MASVYSAGSASVQIVPDFSNAQRRIGQWFAQQNNMKVKVQPDVDRSAVAAMNKKVAAHKPLLRVDIDRKTLARDFVSAVDFVTGTSMVGKALAKLFDVRPILMANLGGAGVAIGASIGHALTTAVGGAAAMLPALMSAAAIPIGTAVLGSQGIGDAFKALGGTTEADAKKLAEAMKDLAPSARDFVTQVHSLAPAFKDLRLDVQEHLFSGLGDSVKNLGQKMLPMLRGHLTGIADEIGGMGKALAEAMSTDGNVADFAHTIDNVKTALHNVAQAIKPLWQAFADLATVGSDFLPGLTQGLGGLAQKFADFIRSARESGALHDFLARAFDGVKQLWGIVKNLGGGLKSIFQAALPYGETLLQIIGLVASDLNSFLKTDAAQSGLQDFFGGLTEAIGNVTPGLMAIVEALVTAVLPAMSGFAAAVAPVVNTVLVQFADLLRDLGPLFYPALAEAISTALGALSPLIGVFAELAKSVLPVVIDAIKMLAPLFTELAEGVGEALVRAIQTLAPSLPPIVEAFSAIAEVLVPLALQLINIAVDILPPFVFMLEGLAKAVQILAPLLPAVLLGFLAWKSIGILTAVFAAVSGALDTVRLKAMYAMDALRGVSRAKLAFGAVAVAAGVVMLAMQDAKQTTDEFAAAILKGGQAAADAAKQMANPSIWEQLKWSLGHVFSAEGWNTKSISENMKNEADEAAKAQLDAMDPLTKAQTLQTQAKNNYLAVLRDEGSTTAEINAAKRRYADATHAVTIEERYQADSTKTATDRLKEQRDAVLAAADAQLAFERSQMRTTEAMDAYNKTMADGNATAEDKKRVELDVRQAIEEQSAAAQKLAEQNYKGTDATEKDRLGKQAYLDKMRELAQQLDGPARAAIDTIIEGLEASNNKASAVGEAMTDLGLKILGVPNEKYVNVEAPTPERIAELERMGYHIEHLPDGSVLISADTNPAQNQIDAMIAKKYTAYITLAIKNGTATAGDIQNAKTVIEHGGGAIGGIVKPMAQGGLNSLFMSGKIATVVKPKTWRVIGDRVTDDEAFIPLNGSARSATILATAADAMGFSLIPNADGGYWTPPGLGSAFSAMGSGSTVVAAERDALRRSQVRTTPQVPSSVAGFVNHGTVVTTDLDELSRRSRLGTQRALAVAGL